MVVIVIISRLMFITTLLAVIVSFAVPGAPANVIVKVENATAVSITWSEPNNPNGNILEYQIIFFGFKTISVSSLLRHAVLFICMFK